MSETQKASICLPTDIGSETSLGLKIFVSQCKIVHSLILKYNVQHMIEQKHWVVMSKCLQGFNTCIPQPVLTKFRVWWRFWGNERGRKGTITWWWVGRGPVANWTGTEKRSTKESWSSNGKVRRDRDKKKQKNKTEAEIRGAMKAEAQKQQ